MTWGRRHTEKWVNTEEERGTKWMGSLMKIRFWTRIQHR